MCIFESRGLSTEYNIAYDCVEAKAHSPTYKNKTALLYFKKTKNQHLKKSEFTYKEISTLTTHAANSLAKLNFKTGSRILISLPNTPETAFTFIGVMKAGLIPILVSPLLKEREVQFLLKDSGAKLLISEKNLSEIFSENSKAKIKTPSTKANDPAYWIYTSGTTGKPKAVIHAHRSIPAHDERVRVWQNFKIGDIVYNTSSLNWSYGLTCGWLDIWRQGGTVVMSQGFTQAEDILEVLKKSKATIFMSVPGIYRRIAEKEIKMPKKVRVCLSAGEKLPTFLKEKFNIREGLGMSEHSVYLIEYFGEKEGLKPVPRHHIEILKNGKRAKPNEIGILASHRSSPGLMLGYYQRPLEEKKVFKGDWFLSGDLAWKDEQGHFHFFGRKDDTITAGGYRISPLEVEKVLNQLPSIEECAVTGEILSEGKTIIVAHIILKKKFRKSYSLKDKIFQQAATQLAPYKCPRKIVFVDQLPKTTNGKIQRKKLLTLA